MDVVAGERSVDHWALWGEAISMAALHACRSREEVAAAMALELERLVPNASVALCMSTGEGELSVVELAFGDGCPWAAGAEVEVASWAVPETQRLPVCYREHALGQLVVSRPIPEEERAMLAAMIAHYGVALVNQTLNKESRDATENYCASLQALEEGIVLFQEEDAEAVQARLLSLASSMMHATAGALYVLRDVGDISSGLELQQALGIPETLLQEFRSCDGSVWPEGMLCQPAQFHVRGDGDFALLDQEGLPPILQNVVAMPLRYHGVEAGICVLFNSTVEVADERDLLGRVQSLGQLGAALLHRVQLEAMAAQNKAIARELQIAETIQKRLIPSQAPPSDAYEFAWLSVAAQHIGGDYLDLLGSDDGDIYAVVADVSGHGINSALLMSSFRSTYRGDAPWTDPSALAASLNNEVVHEVGATGMFITAVMLRLDKGTNGMTLCSAGHNPAMIYRQRGGEVEQIDSHGPPLGFMADAAYEEQKTSLAPGDVLLLYTDGVTEATDAELEMFGEDRLEALLIESAGGSADELVRVVRGAMTEFTGCESFEDDVSMLVIKAS